MKGERGTEIRTENASILNGERWCNAKGITR